MADSCAHHAVLVTVQHATDGPLKPVGGHGDRSSPHGRSSLFTAEPAAHSLDSTDGPIGRQTQNFGDDLLDLRCFDY
jgi:hypothetical protein